MRHALGLAIAAHAPLSFAQPLANASCGLDDVPWVRVEFAGDGWTDKVSSGVVRQLNAGLSPQGLALCLGPTEPHPDRRDPVAVIVLRSENPRSVEVAIEVQDGVTQKHVQRELDLASVPPDGRMLGIAVAADELLRASWVELALEDAPAPAAPPPPAVEKTVQRSLSERFVRPRSSRELEARAAADLYDLSATHLGGDAAFRHIPVHPWGWELGIGLRSILKTRSEHGTVQGSAIGASGAGLLQLVDTDSLAAALELGVLAMQVRYQSEANEGAEANSAADVAVYARAAFTAGWRLDPALSVRFRLGAGAPLRSITVLDEADVSTGVRGPVLFSTLGLAVGL